MFFKIPLILIFIFSISHAQGLFDFFSEDQVENNQIRSRDIDINKDSRSRVLKVKRDETIIEIIPSLTYGYSKLNLEYNNSSNSSETIDSKFQFGLTLNTSFNYFANTNFGYMLNFNYESYNFNEDNISGLAQTDITGNILKIAPILFYSFDIDDVSIYAGFGYGLAKYDLKGTNNYNQELTIDDYSLLSIYKIEFLYGRYIVTILQEKSGTSENGFDSEVDETHLRLGYLISF